MLLLTKYKNGSFPCMICNILGNLIYIPNTSKTYNWEAILGNNIRKNAIRRSEKSFA